MPINWSNVGEQAVYQGMGMLGGMGQARRQHQRQRNLMGLQNQYQRGLNQQGHDLQYDMWNKTNYGAQVKHMLEAGLNPALMYGSAGQGGTTGSQGGGSAAGGQAVGENVMDMQNMLIGRQADLLKAQTNKANAEANKISGVDTDLGRQNIIVAAADAELKAAGIKLSEGQLKKVEAEVEKIKVDTNMAQKIIDLDYSGDYGKNVFENATKALGLTPDEDGALGWDDAMKIGTTVAGLGALKGGKIKASPETKKKVMKAVNRVTGKIVNWYKKLKGTYRNY